MNIDKFILRQVVAKFHYIKVLEYHQEQKQIMKTYNQLKRNT
jgi:hypothetical protein